MKQEVLETPIAPQRRHRNAIVSAPPPDSVIDLSSSSSSGGSDSDNECDLDSAVAGAVRYGASGEGPSKKRRTSDAGVILPVGFLSPLPPAPEAVLSLPAPGWASNSAFRSDANTIWSVNSSKQFWKAGDYDGAPIAGSITSTGACFLSITH